ncbi:MAG: glycosyltransferase family 4 protein, partial [Acidimicrobiales bacterium]
YPELCHPATLGFPALVRRAAAQGSWVHVPSEMVAGEVVELLGVDAERVRTVHHGVPTLPEDERPDRLSGEALPEDERPDRLWGDPLPGESRPEELPGWVERYVLALGTVEPRKDLPSLVRAFGELAAARRGLALVIAGPDGWGSARLEQAIAEAPCPQRVVRLGWVQPAARRRLLAGAAVFGYPSVYEGFGFPPLEAMAAGVPVVATRAGSLPEVLGDGACLVEVGDVDSLAAALAGLLDDESAARSARERGWERTRRFCWRGCSEGLALLYRDAVAGAA